MHDTGCSGLVHWDDTEGWDGEDGGRGVQDGEHMYTVGSHQDAPSPRQGTGQERNLQGSSSSHVAALGVQYVLSGAARTRKESARQLFPSRLSRGPGMSLSSFCLTVVGLSNFCKHNI